MGRMFTCVDPSHIYDDNGRMFFDENYFVDVECDGKCLTEYNDGLIAHERVVGWCSTGVENEIVIDC